MKASGQPVTADLLVREVIVPPDGVAVELELNEGARVVHVARLRKVGGVPSSVQHAYLPYGAFPSLDRGPLVDGSLYRTLEQNYDVSLRRAEQRIKAVPAAADVAELLGVPVGSPVMQTERVTMDEGNRRIEFARSWARPELELTVHLER